MQQLHNVNQGKCLETEERDVGSLVDSKVSVIRSFIITIMQSRIGTT